MILQLDPPLPMITPKGSGLAHILIDYGPEFDLHWTVFLVSNGECWTFANRDIRAEKNITLGRRDVSVAGARQTPAVANGAGTARGLNGQGGHDGA
jgi:hypothetical protein